MADDPVKREKSEEPGEFTKLFQTAAPSRPADPLAETQAAAFSPQSKADPPSQNPETPHKWGMFAVPATSPPVAAPADVVEQQAREADPAPAVGAAGNGPGEFTQMFEASGTRQAPQAKPPGAKAQPEGAPGEFTQLFQQSSATGPSPAVTSQASIGSSPAGSQPVFPPAAKPAAPGEFTKMFERPSPAAPAPGAPPARDDFQDLFPAASSPRPAPAPPKAPEDDFALFRPAPTPPLPQSFQQRPAPWRTSPPAAPPGSAGITGIFGQAQPRSSSAPQAGPSEFTRIISMQPPATPAQPAAGSPQASPEAPAAPTNYWPIIIAANVLILLLIGLVLFLVLRD